MDRFPNITWLRQFNIVAEEGSLLAAGRRLGISQPALSKNMRSLEQELGTELFDRHARGLSLNEFGRILLARSKAIEIEYVFAASEIRNRMAGNEGVIRIGAGPIWGSAVMPTALTQFHKRSPKIQVQLVTGQMESIIAQLEDGKLDLVAGALMRKNLSADFAIEKFADIEIGILASQTHPLAAIRGPVSPAQLAPYPLVAYQMNALPMTFLQNYFRDAKAAPPRYLIETGSLFACLELVRMGSYVLFESKPLVKSPIGYGLVALESAKPIFEFETGLIFHKRLARFAPFQLLKRIIAQSFEATYASEPAVV